jgi:hypothetical protein
MITHHTSIRLLGLATLLFPVGNGFPQGTLNFDNSQAGSVVAPIYSPEPGNPALLKTGNTASGFPAGSQTYGGALLAGTAFTVQLWAGIQGTAESSLMPVFASTTSFLTGELRDFFSRRLTPLRSQMFLRA